MRTHPCIPQDIRKLASWAWTDPATRVIYLNFLRLKEYRINFFMHLPMCLSIDTLALALKQLHSVQVNIVRPLSRHSAMQELLDADVHTDMTSSSSNSAQTRTLTLELEVASVLLCYHAPPTGAAPTSRRNNACAIVSVHL